MLTPLANGAKLGFRGKWVLLCLFVVSLLLVGKVCLVAFVGVLWRLQPDWAFRKLDLATGVVLLVWIWCYESPLLRDRTRFGISGKQKQYPTKGGHSVDDPSLVRVPFLRCDRNSCQKLCAWTNSLQLVGGFSQLVGAFRWVLAEILCVLFLPSAGDPFDTPRVDLGLPFLEVPFLVALKAKTTEKSWYPYSNLSTGGPRRGT